MFFYFEFFNRYEKFLRRERLRIRLNGGHINRLYVFATQFMMSHFVHNRLPILLRLYLTENLIRVPLTLDDRVYFTLQLNILFMHFIDIFQVLFSICLSLKNARLL